MLYTKPVIMDDIPFKQQHVWWLINYTDYGCILGHQSFVGIDMDKTMPCLPPMPGNGKHITYKNGDDWGMADDCFTHENNFI